VPNLFGKISCPEKLETMGDEGPGNHATSELTGVRGIVVLVGEQGIVPVQLILNQIISP
jgi:hypothetical protein